MRREGYYIIRCPKCGRYTYAPIRQKTRLCVYCQRIFKVNPLNAQYVKQAEIARTRVKVYQTGKHHEEFQVAVEQSRDKVKSLLPSKEISAKSLQEKARILPSSARRRVFETILHKYAGKEAVDLQIFEEECQKAGLPWSWASQQLEGLIRSGDIICPKPWQIRLVTSETFDSNISEGQYTQSKLARRIGEIIRYAGTPVTHTQILQQFEKESIDISQIKQALEMLKNQGYIFKSRDETYQWIG